MLAACYWATKWFTAAGNRLRTIQQPMQHHRKFIVAHFKRSASSKQYGRATRITQHPPKRHAAKGIRTVDAGTVVSASTEPGYRARRSTETTTAGQQYDAANYNSNSIYLQCSRHSGVRPQRLRMLGLVTARRNVIICLGRSPFGSVYCSRCSCGGGTRRPHTCSRGCVFEEK